MKFKFREVSPRQAQVVFAFSMANMAVQAVAGRVLLKHVEKVETKAEGLRDVADRLRSVAIYQQAMLDRVAHFDSFDEVALETLNSDFRKAMEKLAEIYEVDLDTYTVKKSDPPQDEKPA